MDSHASLEQLYVEGLLSLRAIKCCRQAHLLTVRDVALYHRDDPRYLTLAGCGKLTRRELNGLIKEAYGRLALTKAQLADSAPAPTDEGSWQSRWEAATSSIKGATSSAQAVTAYAKAAASAVDIPEGSVAAEWEEEGTLTKSDAAYLRKCTAYADLIRSRSGVPYTAEELALHQWFLKQWNSQTSLPPHRKALFEELLQKL